MPNLQQEIGRRKKALAALAAARAALAAVRAALEGP